MAMMSMEYAVVDMQGFRRSSYLFIVKEFAVLTLEADALPKVYHFFPPCTWQKLLIEEKSTIEWLELSFHGIPWYSGHIPYSDIIRIMQSSQKDIEIIYVKGLEKKKKAVGNATGEVSK